MTRSAILWATAGLLLAAVPAHAQPAPARPPVPLPDLSAILPPPPAPGSPMHRRDLQRFMETRALQGTARWQQAARDADLRPAALLADFAEAAGLPQADAPAAHPALLWLLARITEEAMRLVEPEKRATHVSRPFVGNDEPTCVPHNRLSGSFAYPSGHTTIGWAVALTLAELRPERATAILARGMAFGESRVVCGVHWQSDVDAGRIAGAVLAAALHGDPDFRNELAAAGRKIAGVP